MRAIAQFIVKLADLAEAEGRLLRAGTVRVLLAGALALAAALLAVGGLALLAWALFQALSSTVGIPGAAAICGFALLALAFALFVRVNALAGSPKPPQARTPTDRQP